MYLSGPETVSIPIPATNSGDVLFIVTMAEQERFTQYKESTIISHILLLIDVVTVEETKLHILNMKLLEVEEG